MFYLFNELMPDLSMTECVLFSFVHAIYYRKLQENEMRFCTCSNNYISKCLGISKPTIIKALKGLESKGFISIRYREGQVFQVREIIPKLIDLQKILALEQERAICTSKETLLAEDKKEVQPSKETLRGVVKNLDGGVVKNLYNNKDISNKEYNNIYISDSYESPSKESLPELKDAKISQEAEILDSLDKLTPTLKDTLKSPPRASKRGSRADREGTMACGEFKSVFLTPEELAKLYDRFGRSQTLSKLHYLDGQIASGLKKYTQYKNHYATLRNWLASAVTATASRPKTFQEIDNDRAKEILAPSDIVDLKDNNIFIAMAQEKNVGRTR